MRDRRESSLVSTSLAAASLVAFVPSTSDAQTARTALEVSSPNDSYTSRTPNPYVRLWVHNRTSASRRLRILSVTLTAPTRARITVRTLQAESGPAANVLTIAPGSRALVGVYFDRSASVLDAVYSDASFTVVYSDEGASASIDLTVRRAIRFRSRKR